MGHIGKIAERILFLKGEVEMVASGPVKKITEAEAMLTEAIRSEQQSVQDYSRFALQCSEVADAASRKIFEDLVADEERHADGFEKQSDKSAPSARATSRSSLSSAAPRRRRSDLRVAGRRTGGLRRARPFHFPSR
jgi:rubrerythrin